MKAIVGILATLIVVGCTADKEPVEKEKSAAVQPVAEPAKSKNSREDKLAADNYLRVTEGMRRDDVLLILGRPTESDFEEQDRRLQKVIGQPGGDFVAKQSRVHEKWDSQETFQGISLRTIRVTYQWTPEKPGSPLGAWKVVRKSNVGLR